MFERAGVPEGLVRVVHGPGTGSALVEVERGEGVLHRSVEIGRGVGEECARRLKGSVLELGGKDPMIVLADANLDHAVAGALWGGFANAGQTCSGIERVYVMREVAERFIAGVVAGAQRLRIGDPTRLGHRDRADGLARAVRDRRASWSTMRSPRARRCAAAARSMRRPGSSRRVLRARRC